MISSKRIVSWVTFLAFSTALHAIVSGRIGQQIEPLPLQPPPDEEVQIIVEQPPQPLLEKEPPPEEQLEFEQELELDPPEILIAPKAVAPPPPDVTLALKAQAGGFQGIEIPSALGVGTIPVSEGQGFGGFKTGIGNGLGDGTARFAAYVAGLREAGLDVMFVIDATGSMDWVLQEVKDRIDDIVQIVRSLVPIARFGFVAYRDHDDPEFTTRVLPLTYSTTKLQQFSLSLQAEGGGDWYEAIDVGIRDAIEQAGWRLGARRLIIVIGDAPLRDGQLSKIVRHIEQFQRAGGVVSTLDVSDQANPHLLEAKLGRKVSLSLYRNSAMQEFQIIGEAGQGDTATLDGDTKLTKRLIKLIMGDQFATQMQALLDVL